MSRKELFEKAVKSGFWYVKTKNGWSVGVGKGAAQQILATNCKSLIEAKDAIIKAWKDNKVQEKVG